MDKDNRDLMTTEQIVDYLQISKSTLYKWCHEQYIPHIKLGNKLRFDKDKVEQWIADRECAGRTERTPRLKKRK